MYDFTKPLKGLFNNSKRLILDVIKIGPNIPGNEIFQKLFQTYADVGIFVLVNSKEISINSKHLIVSPVIQTDTR